MWEQKVGAFKAPHNKNFVVWFFFTVCSFVSLNQSRKDIMSLSALADKIRIVSETLTKNCMLTIFLSLSSHLLQGIRNLPKLTIIPAFLSHCFPNIQPWWSTSTQVNNKSKQWHTEECLTFFSWHPRALCALDYLLWGALMQACMCRKLFLDYPLLIRDP